MTAGLILVLYVLAYFGAMEFVWIPALIALGFGVYRVIRSRSLDKDNVIGFVVFAVLCLVTANLIKDHVVKWWDDVNYWATDAKALYYLNGFTGKYGNVAPEFGDYPPGIQIAKWCMLKLSPHIYKEGLAFIGYTLMNMIFMLPLMRAADRMKLPAKIAWMLVIMLIPGIVNDVWSYGACADVTMGIVYGAMLTGIYEIVTGFGDGKTQSVEPGRTTASGTASDTGSGRMSSLPYVKVALYGAITAICKNTGFMWVTFAAILLIVLTIMNRIRKTPVIFTIIFIYLVQGSWWANCILNRRIAKLTGALARTATGGGMTMPEDASDKLHYYILGFLKEPMHTAHTWALDISAFAMFALIVACFAFLVFACSKQKKTVRAGLVYSVVTGLAIYIIVLLSHMSIFATETQYGSSEVMAISISRYGAPFTIGTFMLLICMGADIMSGLHAGNKKREESTDNDTTDAGSRDGYDRSVIIWIAAIAVFIMLTTDYPAYGYLLGGYRADRDADLKARAEMIDPEGQEFIDYLENMPKEEYDAVKGHRVLFLRDGSRIHWVNDTYISYEAAPIAAVYASRDEGMTEDEVDEIIRLSHAEYVYSSEEGIRRVD